MRDENGVGVENGIYSDGICFSSRNHFHACLLTAGIWYDIDKLQFDGLMMTSSKMLLSHGDTRGAILPSTWSENSEYKLNKGFSTAGVPAPPGNNTKGSEVSSRITQD